MQWKKVVAIYLVTVLISIGVGFVDPNQLVAEEWGQGPFFMADKTDVCVGELVTFDNLTTGDTHPYIKAEWDFNSDGIIDTTLTGTESEVMADVTWAYDKPGVYTVRLWMTDSTPTTRYGERPSYITVGDCVTWTFPNAGIFPRHLPDWYTGQVVLADLDPATIPNEVQGVQWFDQDALEWMLWIPSVGGSLTTLTAGNDYWVSISGACEWEIPLQTPTPTPFVILNLPAGINVDPVAFNLVYYDGVEVTLPTGTEPPELIAVYYYDPVALELLYYFPGWPSLMTRLEHGKVYLVIVSDACQWLILP